MKILLPGFLLLCLGVAPLICQDVQSSAVEVVSEGAGSPEVESTNASTPVAETEVNTATMVVAEEAPMFGSDVPQLSLLRVFGGMGLVLCLLVGAYLCIRKFAPGYFPKVSTDGKNLKIVESIGMGERRSIALVEVGGKRFLIGSTPQQINLLTTLPEHFSLVAEDDGASDVVKASAVKEEGERQVFRNLFDKGKRRSVRHSENVLSDEIRQKMRRLREALENR